MVGAVCRYTLSLFEAIPSSPSKGPTDMNNGEAKIRRTLHFRFTLPGASEQVDAMIKSSAPLYQMFGQTKVRLLQNVDDPSRYLQAWRTMVAGSIDIEVFKAL